jgi:hypothetical protein
VLVFVREFRHPVERVWAALTDPRPPQGLGAVHGGAGPVRAGDTTLTMLDGESRGGPAVRGDQGRAADAARVHRGARTSCGGSSRRVTAVPG